jgi:hypothetical protein
MEKVVANRKEGPIPLLMTVGLTKQFEQILQDDFSTSRKFVNTITNLMLNEILSMNAINVSRNAEQMPF